MKKVPIDHKSPSREAEKLHLGLKGSARLQNMSDMTPTNVANRTSSSKR